MFDYDAKVFIYGTKSYYLYIYWQSKTIDRKHSNFSISLFSYFLRKSLIWIRRIWEKLYNNVYTYFLSKTYQFLLQTKNKTPIEYLQCFQKVFTRMLELYDIKKDILIFHILINQISKYTFVWIHTQFKEIILEIKLPGLFHWSPLLL